MPSERLIRLTQSLKAEFSITVVPLPIVTLVKLSQFSKAEAPMVFAPLPIETVVILLHPSKADAPTAVTPSPKTIIEILLQSAKEPDGISPPFTVTIFSESGTISLLVPDTNPGIHYPINRY